MKIERARFYARLLHMLLKLKLINHTTYHRIISELTIRSIVSEMEDRDEPSK